MQIDQTRQWKLRRKATIFCVLFSLEMCCPELTQAIQETQEVTFYTWRNRPCKVQLRRMTSTKVQQRNMWDVVSHLDIIALLGLGVVLRWSSCSNMRPQMPLSRKVNPSRTRVMKHILLIKASLAHSVAVPRKCNTCVSSNFWTQTISSKVTSNWGRI